jgi:hypothetical protein
MPIGDRQGHSANTDLSSRESLESNSNVTPERTIHPSTHRSEIISTDEGMAIDESDMQRENAKVSIRESLKPDSNVNPERVMHLSKHRSPMTSTDEGIQIDESNL